MNASPALLPLLCLCCTRTRCGVFHGRVLETPYQGTAYYKSKLSDRQQKVEELQAENAQLQSALAGSQVCTGPPHSALSLWPQKHSSPTPL